MCTRTMRGETPSLGGPNSTRCVYAVLQCTTPHYTINGICARWQIAVGPRWKTALLAQTLWKKWSLLVLFQNKWCHSTHLKPNNRSDECSVRRTAAVGVITKGTRGAPTQPHRAFVPVGRITAAHSTCRLWRLFAFRRLQWISFRSWMLHCCWCRPGNCLLWIWPLGVVSVRGHFAVCVCGNGAGESATCWFVTVLH